MSHLERRANGLRHALVTRLKFRQLSLLLAVEQHRTVTRVAAELGLSQPAVTKAIQEVEGIFDCPLFDRTGRGMSPTTAGRAVLDLVRRWFAELDAATHVLTSIEAGRQGRLRLGVAHGIPDSLLLAALHELIAGPQRVAVMTREGTTDDLVAALRSRELDCAIGRSYDGDATGLVQQSLYEQEACLVMVAASARRLTKVPFDLAKLSRLDWIMPPANTPVRRIYNAMFVAAGLQPPVPLLETVYGRSVGAVLRMEPNAIAIVARDVVGELIGLGGCAVLPYRLSLNLPPICFFALKGMEKHPVVSAVQAKMIATGQALTEQRRQHGNVGR